MTDSYSFLQSNVCTVFGIPFQMDYGLWETSLSKCSPHFCVWCKRGRLCYFFALILIVAEAASISFCTLSFYFPLMAISLFPVKAEILPFSSHHQYSCFNSFVPGLKISCPDLFVGVVVRGCPPPCKSSRQSDSWWRNLSTEGAWRCAGYVLSVLGVALVVPIVLRVLMS